MFDLCALSGICIVWVALCYLVRYLSHDCIVCRICVALSGIQNCLERIANSIVLMPHLNFLPPTSVQQLGVEQYVKSQDSIVES